MDIELGFRPRSLESDINLSGPDLLAEFDLKTAIIISLFTDRRANPDDILDDIDDRRGWWGDSYSPINNDKIGSRLWLLARSKQTQQVVNRARQYCIEATRWLIDDAIASSVEVETEIVRMGTLGIMIKVTRPQGVANFKYQYVWDQI